MARRRISVIGSGHIDSEQYQSAQQLGYGLAKTGYDIVCGGLGGVMEAVCKGAQQAGGHTIGILPGKDILEANPYIDYPLATGLGHMRNYLVVLNGEMVVAYAGAAGTLSEIGLALKSGKKVIACGPWSTLPDVLAARDVDQILELVKNESGL